MSPLPLSSLFVNQRHSVGLGGESSSPDVVPSLVWALATSGGERNPRGRILAVEGWEESPLERYCLCVTTGCSYFLHGNESTEHGPTWDGARACIPCEFLASRDQLSVVKEGENDRRQTMLVQTRKCRDHVTKKLGEEQFEWEIDCTEHMEHQELLREVRS